MGKLPLEAVKPGPLAVAEYTVTGAVPVEESVSICDVVVLTTCDPKFTLDALTLRVGTRFGPSAAMPVPLSPTTIVPLFDVSLAIVSCPVIDPTPAGSNCTAKAVVWPGGRVTGKFGLDSTKPFPDTDAAVTLTASVPVDVRVRDSVAAEPTVTFPNDSLGELILRPGVSGFNWRRNVSAIPFKLADSVAVWSELTAATVVEKLALVAPAPTVTADGTLTAALLLDNATASPPLGAAELMVTVQVSDPAPVSDPLAQLKACSPGTFAAVPVPLKLTAIVPLAALLWMVSCPVAASGPAGAKRTVRFSVAPAATVRGMLVAPLTENDCPDTVMLET